MQYAAIHRHKTQLISTQIIDKTSLKYNHTYYLNIYKLVNLRRFKNEADEMDNLK